MGKQKIKILAIESSCDETAASVIVEKENKPIILSNVISSQIDLHAKTGGVVPEVASRAHMEAIIPVIVEALNSANLDALIMPDNENVVDIQRAITLLNEITHVAVTAGPGLVGSLLVGLNAAKTIAYTKNLPIIPLNHIEGHVYSALADCEIKFPILALTVSGGHTSITLIKGHGEYLEIGSTIDDAVGEAYDKVGKLLDLGYPGGPIVSEFAKQFRQSSLPSKIVFPRPIINDNTFNFSFSGLKTAVLVYLKNLLNEYKNVLELPIELKQEICAAFEEAVKDVLIHKTEKAVLAHKPKSILFAGGVSANQYLRDSLKELANKLDVDFNIPAAGLYGDNAAMIGVAAYYHIKRGDTKTWQETNIDTNLAL